MRSPDSPAPRKLSLRLLVAVIACLACSPCAWPQTSVTAPLGWQPRRTLEAHLKAFSRSDRERESLIRKWLAEAGCRPANLSEQDLDRSLPPNVICVLPGETDRVLVASAHTDHVSAGDGVIDNWTGAVLLPALLYSLRRQPRHHTLIFIGFSAEEKGLVGSRYYVDHLGSAQRAQIDAVVNFDSLGLGPAEVWASHADQILLRALDSVAAANHLTVNVMNPENGASADSESFARYQIPRITLHSVTERTWPILHSPADNLATVKLTDYYDSYRLIAQYLAYLDGALNPPK